MLTCAMRQLGGHVAGHVNGQQDDCSRGPRRCEHTLNDGNALQPAAAAVQQRIHNGAGYHHAPNRDVHRLGQDCHNGYLLHVAMHYLFDGTHGGSE